MTTKPVHHTGPPGAPPAAQRGAPEVSGDPFAAILETTQARTATPEGHPERIADRDPRPAEPVPAQEDAVPGAAEAVPVAVAVPTPAAPPALADVPAVAPVAPEVPPVAARVSVAVPATAAQTQPVTATPAVAGAAAQVEPEAVEGDAPVAPPVAGPAPQLEPRPEQPTTGRPVARAHAATPATRPTPAHADGPAAPATPAVPVQPAASDPRRPAGPAPASVDQAAPAQAAQAAQPATSAAPATPAQPATTPPLHAVDRAEQPYAAHAARAAETVELAIRLAAQRGASHARLQLRPAELGGVEIHLRHSADGIAARVTADAPEAARLLTQAAADLRRSLEDQGMTVLRLDVQVATSDPRTSGGSAAAGDGRHNGAAGTNHDHHDAEPEAEAPVQRVALSTGVLVDLKA